MWNLLRRGIAGRKLPSSGGASTARVLWLADDGRLHLTRDREGEGNNAKAIGIDDIANVVQGSVSAAENANASRAANLLANAGDCCVSITAAGDTGEASFHMLVGGNGDTTAARMMTELLQSLVRQLASSGRDALQRRRAAVHYALTGKFRVLRRRSSTANLSSDTVDV